MTAEIQIHALFKKYPNGTEALKGINLEIQNNKKVITMNTANILLIERGIIKLIKNPAAPIMGFGMSLFFLLVYNAGIGGTSSASFFFIGLLIFSITSVVSVTFALSSANMIKI